MGACMSIVLVHFQVKASFEIFVWTFSWGRRTLRRKKMKELIRVQFEKIHGPSERNNESAE